MNIVRAPWSQDQVDALNRFQQRGDVHEFTCPLDHGDDGRTLIATKDGWICPSCGYTQNWAHRIMFATGMPS